MKILLTGGSTGGHFFPLIAVTRALKKIADKERIVSLKLFLADTKPFDKDMLEREEIEFIRIPAGKVRRYFSLLNLSDTISTLFGLVYAFWRIYFLMPDVVFSKGGYSSFPSLVAARLFKIPVIIHESDLVPGLVNKWASNWVDRIAISFADSTKYFEGKQIELTGNPVRSQVIGGNLGEALESFKLEEDLPTILVMGGSQGSEKINETILSLLKILVDEYQIMHQTGKANFDDVSGRAAVILERSDKKHRYHPYPFLNENNLRDASRVASLVIARGGSALFEIAAWNLPSIIVPLPNSAQDHQRKNAYAYARAGACEVIEETNLTSFILKEEIKKILDDPELTKRMKLAAQTFSRLDAAEKIAEEIIKLGIHE